MQERVINNELCMRCAGRMGWDGDDCAGRQGGLIGVRRVVGEAQLTAELCVGEAQSEWISWQE